MKRCADRVIDFYFSFLVLKLVGRIKSCMDRKEVFWKNNCLKVIFEKKIKTEHVSEKIWKQTKLHPKELLVSLNSLQK